MTPDQGASAAFPAAKVGASWIPYGIGKLLVAVGIHSWSDYSFAAGGLLSTCLILDFFWKKWKGKR